MSDDLYGQTRFTLPTSGAADAPLVFIELNQEWALILLGLVADLENSQAWVEGTDELESYWKAIELAYQVWNWVTPMTNIIGEIRLFAGGTIPAGWLQCNGQVQLKTDYPDLYAVIGDTYSFPGDPAGYFRTPHLAARFPIGVDPGDTSGLYALGGNGGEYTHLLSDNEMTHNHTVPRAGGGGGASPLSQAGTVNFAFTTSTLGTPPRLAHNNMPPFTTVNYIIFTGVT